MPKISKFNEAYIIMKTQNSRQINPEAKPCCSRPTRQLPRHLEAVLAAETAFGALFCSLNTRVKP